LRPSRNPKRA